MPPAQKPDVCRYDESEFRKRVEKIEDLIWHSNPSLLMRVDRLEQASRAQERLIKLYLPFVFSIATSGLFFLLQMLTNHFLGGD